MKKSEFFIIVVLLVISIIPFSFAAQEDVDKAYDCLNEQIDDATCAELSVEEQIFSYLSVGRCGSQLISNSRDNECWPSSNCNLRITSQALLALKTNPPREWLFEQIGVPSELTWYLQIEPERESNCRIAYKGEEYSFDIGEDDKISSSAGTCLYLSASEYWFEISPNCYGEEFIISCEEAFLTNLLFRSSDSSKIHVSEKTSYAAAGGRTYEEVNSFCFEQSGSCNYVGSLWATLALSSLGEDISPYLPYLITEAPENEVYFPDVFLYILTGYEDFRYNILSKQSLVGYWSVSGDRYKDTALALYPFRDENFREKADAQDWLIEQQGNNGCWNSGSIIDTAFILHSVWSRYVAPYTPPYNPPSNGGEDKTCLELGGRKCSSGTQCSESTVEASDTYYCCLGTCEEPANPPTVSCTSVGYYCMSSSNCNDAGGAVLDYKCLWPNHVCCTTKPSEETCADAGGEICASGKKCSQRTLTYSDTEECCFGICESISPAPSVSCSSAGYYCMSSLDCNKIGGKVLNYSCSGFSICCDKEKIAGETCEEAGGEICASGKKCSQRTFTYSDTEECCFGQCEEPKELDECTSMRGVCEPYECGKGYSLNSEYECEYPMDLCCIPDAKKSGPKALFWIFLILVILVSLGIIFRKNLTEFWFKIKSKFGKKKPKPPRTGPLGLPSINSRNPFRRTSPRRILPSSSRHSPRTRPFSRPSSHSSSKKPIFKSSSVPSLKAPEKSSELDDVLKKLKDMEK